MTDDNDDSGVIYIFYTIFCREQFFYYLCIGNITNYNMRFKEEINESYTMAEAIKEAQRCLHCKVPQCKKGCPISNDIPDWIHELKKGNLGNAISIIRAKSNLPAVCGRVCAHEKQCEGNCVLGKKGSPVNIGKLERFVADFDSDNDLTHEDIAEKTRGKIAVIGAGPSGITVAGDLSRMGFAVEIFEMEAQCGGVLRYGIPEYRLPKEVVAREIRYIEKMGVVIHRNTHVGENITVESLFAQGFDAIFIGSGAGLPKFMNIPGETANGVLSANEFLTRVNLMKGFREDYDTPIHVGKKVVVVGGGNVAMDAVRTSLRLGAEATIVYRRGMEELPARAEEIHHAVEEGVVFNTLTNPTEVLVDDQGNVTGLKCVKMELGEPDASGRRRPVVVPNSEFIIDCDMVIMSLGTSPNPLISSSTKGLETNSHGCLIAQDETGLTTRENVYAGGDAVTGAATVILAMGAGKSAAAAIDEKLSK